MHDDGIWKVSCLRSTNVLLIARFLCKIAQSISDPVLDSARFSMGFEFCRATQVSFQTSNYPTLLLLSVLDQELLPSLYFLMFVRYRSLDNVFSLLTQQGQEVHFHIANFPFGRP